MKLQLECNQNQVDRTAHFVLGGEVAMVTPPINKDYWLFRVKLTETQAVLGFPKFSTVGIGFAVEEDWNTNLPYKCDTLEIFNHILKNKGDDSIKDENVIEAIKMIQEAAKLYKEATKQ